MIWAAYWFAIRTYSYLRAHKKRLLSEIDWQVAIVASENTMQARRAAFPDEVAAERIFLSGCAPTAFSKEYKALFLCTQPASADGWMDRWGCSLGRSPHHRSASLIICAIPAGLMTPQQTHTATVAPVIFPLSRRAVVICTHFFILFLPRGEKLWTECGDEKTDWVARISTHSTQIKMVLRGF